MNNRYRSAVPMWVILITVILVGCVEATKTASTDTLCMKTLTPSSMQPTSTPSRTHSPTAQPTRTPTQRPTNTPRPTRTATWTPVPTLNPQDAKKAMLDLYADNGGCELPCWWGIMPGVTSWAEANNILGPLGEVSATRRSWGVQLDYRLPAPKEIYDFNIGYLEPDLIVRDGVVGEIGINIRWTEESFDHSLAGMLSTFGQPQEILLDAYSEPIGFEMGGMLLLYPDEGILVQIASQVNREGDLLRICPQEIIEPTPTIYLWTPGQKLALSRIFDSLKIKRLRPLETASELSIDLFYETYHTENVNECFNTPIELWP